MAKENWLIAWIGKTDHDAAEGNLGDDLGPIGTAVSEERYDRIYLLTNYAHARSAGYCDWLAQRADYAPDDIDLFDIELHSPVDYEAIYKEVSTNLSEAKLPREDVALTYHLSPGTPAMAVVWIVLARTRFPARLIQTTRNRGVLEVSFFSEVTDAFLPEYLRRAGERFERLADGPKGTPIEFRKIVHRSGQIQDRINLARRIAAYNVPVLILGETGTGKELFAEAIHASSPRSKGPYITVNCGAMAPELANSEIFGHVKGSFTGAIANRKGHFAEANGGTLFLDEIGDLPLETQVRLLRVLQAKEVTPVGASTPTPVDVRIIAATHRDLAVDVAAGRFREDLYHRLAVGILQLPPLRDRPGDIDLLVETFMSQINADSRGMPEAIDKFISENGKLFIHSYAWPGNVRELYHTLLRAVIISSGQTISLEEIQAAILSNSPKKDGILDRPLTERFDLEDLLDEVSCHYITRALERTGGKKTSAAKLLGFANHQTLGNWLKRLNITDHDT